MLWARLAARLLGANMQCCVPPLHAVCRSPGVHFTSLLHQKAGASVKGYTRGGHEWDPSSKHIAASHDAFFPRSRQRSRGLHLGHRHCVYLIDTRPQLALQR